MLSVSGSGEFDLGAGRNGEHLMTTEDDRLTIEEWRAALPGPLGTPGLPDEAVLRLAYLVFADDPGASPDMADFEAWRERRVMTNG